MIGKDKFCYSWFYDFVVDLINFQNEEMATVSPDLPKKDGPLVFLGNVASGMGTVKLEMFPI